MKSPPVQILAVAATLLAVLSSCEKRHGQVEVLTQTPAGSAPQSAPTDADDAGQPFTGRILFANRSPVTFTGEGNPFIQELIHGGAFDGADIDIAGAGYFRPNRWYTSEAGREHAFVFTFPGREDQGQLLQLIPLRTGELTVSQVINDLGTVAAGATIAVTAEARTKSPGQLAIVLSYKSNDLAGRAVVIHPGGDEWKTLLLQHTFPMEGPPTDLTLSVARRSVSGLTSQVDNVSARLLRPEDVRAGDGANKSELLLGTNFDEPGWFGDAGYWRTANWGGATYTTAEWVIDDQAPERMFVVALPPPPVGGVSLVQNVEGLTASNRGKTLVLSAWGKASAPRELGITVKYAIKGEDRNAVAEHSGSGQWEQMIARVAVPVDGHPHTARIELYRRHMGELPVYLDSPSFAVAE